MAMYVYNISTVKIEGRGLQVPGHTGLHSKTLCQKKSLYINYICGKVLWNLVHSLKKNKLNFISWAYYACSLVENSYIGICQSS
jgi:hypothetical protein